MRYTYLHLEKQFEKLTQKFRQEKSSLIDEKDKAY